MVTTRRMSAEEDWKISVRLTLEEIELVARGRLPRSLVRYCRRGLQHWEGSEELARLRARIRRRDRSRAAR